MSRAVLRWTGADRRACRFDLPRPPTSFLIGRSPDAGLHLAGDAAVSRRHARVAWLDDCWIIEDVGSMSGTLVVRRDSPPLTGPVALRDQDQVHVGATILLFTAGVASPTDDPGPTITPSAVALALPLFELVRALCSAYLSGEHDHWASNGWLGDELGLSEPGVRARMTKTYAAFGISTGNNVERRMALVQKALRDGYFLAR